MQCDQFDGRARDFEQARRPACRPANGTRRINFTEAYEGISELILAKEVLQAALDLRIDFITLTMRDFLKADSDLLVGLPRGLAVTLRRLEFGELQPDLWIRDDFPVL